MAEALNLEGQRFGRLTAMARSPRTNDRGETWWFCKCDCGNTKEIRTSCLRRGMTKSCGCLKREVESLNGKKNSTKHGWYGTKVYEVWRRLVSRCEDSNNSQYPNYGGRGIQVCAEWRNDPKAFCEWAIANGYSEGLSIDRIDVNGDYEPNNCRWLTMDEQQRNKRNNVRVTYMGKTQCVAEWARELGLNQMPIYARVHKGWTDPEKILFGIKGRR